MANVQFTDNSAQVIAELKSAAKQWLYESGGVLQAKIFRNSRVDLGQTRGSYQYNVDEESGECSVGSNLQNAIWEEYGTGEYALNGDGRKGGWYVPEGELTPKAKTKMKKVIGKDGKIYYFTYGKTPNKPMKKAFDSEKELIQRRLEQIVREKLG